MGQLDDLNAAISAVSDDVKQISTDVDSVLALLKQSPPDLAGAIATLQGVKTAADQVDANLKGALPQPPGP